MGPQLVFRNFSSDCSEKPAAKLVICTSRLRAQRAISSFTLLYSREQKKSIHHHRGTPLFLVCRPTLRSQSKKAMVYTIFLEKQGKRVYTIGLERRVYTIEPQTWKKKKGGSPRWWCILFSSLIFLRFKMLLRRCFAFPAGPCKFGACDLGSRECRQSKEAPKPRPRKVLKRGLRKVPAANGVPRKVTKRCSGVRASVENFSTETKGLGEEGAAGFRRILPQNPSPKKGQNSADHKRGQPRFSTPREMRFSHARKGKRPFQKKPSTKAVFPFSRGKNRISQGVENRGSLISVPLALRVLARKVPDTFNFLRHVMRAILSARPKCSHRCVSQGTL